MTTIYTNAARYADHDDSLTAAAAAVASAYGLDGWELSPRWDSEQRDRILVDVPESVLEQSRLRGWRVEGEVPEAAADSWQETDLDHERAMDRAEAELYRASY